MPAVEQDGNVVVPMKENEWLLMNNNEKGVKEFTVMGVLQSVRTEFFASV